jgi:prepilin-type processing-associated H-X9-DG protein
MKRNAAFSLVELLVVIGIILLLAWILLPVFIRAKHKAKQTSCMANQRQVSLAVSLYAGDDNDTYPVLTTSFNFANPGYPARTKYFSWMLATEPYSKSDQVYYCPEAKNNERIFSFNLGSKQVDLPERHMGTNEFLMPNSADPSFRGPVAETSIGKAALLPLLADSVYVDFDNPDYIILADYDSPALEANSSAFELDPDLAKDRSNPAFARHGGGSNIVFADLHSRWMGQLQMGLDAKRAAYPYEQGFLLPVDPNDDRIQ